MMMIEPDILPWLKIKSQKWSLFSNLYIVSDQPILFMVNNILSDNNSDESERRKKHYKSDADELKEVAEALPQLFSAINESVPKLISGLIGSVYSPESAGNIASGIGKFYSNLIAEGIPEDVALDMTKKFVSALDFTKLMNMVGDEASFEMSHRMKRKASENHDDDDDEELD